MRDDLTTNPTTPTDTGSTMTATTATAPTAVPPTATRTDQPATAPGGGPVVVRADVGPALRQACARIAPLWPLERFVAVNPYLGLTDHTFAAAAGRLAAAAGARTTMPLPFYLGLVDRGRITDEDLAAALADDGRAVDPAAFVESARRAATDPAADDPTPAPTVADVATQVTGRDWSHFCTDRIAAWAAAHFDAGQAMWRSSDRTLPPFAAWKAEAEVDRTPDVMGLRGFRAAVRSLPDAPVEAAEVALAELAVPAEALELYLHRLLLRVGGWAAHAARIVWDAGLAGREDDTLVELLAVQLAWEAGVLRTLGDRGVTAAWHEATDQLAALAARVDLHEPLARLVVLQDAFDRSEQRRLVGPLGGTGGATTVTAPAARPDAQAVFCIDVRSEVVRRHLEAAAADAVRSGDGSGIETIGFAGFFGFPVEYLPIAHDRGEAQCPVLLTPSHAVAESVADPAAFEHAVASRRLKHQVRRAWKSFKMGAISCFSFVGPVGLMYLPKLFSDASGRTRPVARPEDEGLPRAAAHARGPSLDAPSADLAGLGIPTDDRVDLAEGALRAMSLTSGFAPLVMITGHGATTVNNPYDTGLDCGACGGHTGEANSRVAAAVLNDPAVRSGLADRGIDVPADTWFVAAQHDTTTDRITVFDRHLVPASHRELLDRLDRWTTEAGGRARRERARRLGIDADADVDRDVLRRSTDWAQVRPEWGLAGCRAFVVAPRSRTQGVDLGGQAFLHSYDWRRDEGFGVLELVMTAPMVVASWISLQYYASTVDNRVFGSGNKTLHNVVGRLGVLEGTAGDLRVGLPWQSVHDGERLQHEPLRLNVVIEAPIDAMNDVLARHDDVRALVDNGWLQLLAMGDDGRVSHRYAGGLRWEPVTA